MDYTINLELGSLIFVVLSTAVLAFIVIYHNPSNFTNRLFSLLSLSFAIWAMVNYFSLHPPIGQNLFWIRLVLITAAPQAVLFALFMRAFPSTKFEEIKKEFYIFAFFLVIQIYLSITPLVFEGISVVNGRVIPIIG